MPDRRLYRQLHGLVRFHFCLLNASWFNLLLQPVALFLKLAHLHHSRCYIETFSTCALPLFADSCSFTGCKAHDRPLPNTLQRVVRQYRTCVVEHTAADHIDLHGPSQEQKEVIHQTVAGLGKGYEHMIQNVEYRVPSEVIVMLAQMTAQVGGYELMLNGLEVSVSHSADTVCKSTGDMHLCQHVTSLLYCVTLCDNCTANRL